jgi:hypothetical protein
MVAVLLLGVLGGILGLGVLRRGIITIVGLDVLRLARLGLGVLWRGCILNLTVLGLGGVLNRSLCRVPLLREGGRLIYRDSDEPGRLRGSDSSGNISADLLSGHCMPVYSFRESCQTLVFVWPSSHRGRGERAHTSNVG